MRRHHDTGSRSLGRLLPCPDRRVRRSGCCWPTTTTTSGRRWCRCSSRSPTSWWWPRPPTACRRSPRPVPPTRSWCSTDVRMPHGGPDVVRRLVALPGAPVVVGLSAQADAATWVRLLGRRRLRLPAQGAARRRPRAAAAPLPGGPARRRRPRRARRRAAAAGPLTASCRRSSARTGSQKATTVPTPSGPGPVRHQPPDAAARSRMPTTPERRRPSSPALHRLPRPVVDDADLDAARRALDGDPHRPGAAVLAGVDQRLPRDPVGRHAHRAGEGVRRRARPPPSRRRCRRRRARRPRAGRRAARDSRAGVSSSKSRCRSRTAASCTVSMTACTAAASAGASAGAGGAGSRGAGRPRPAPGASRRARPRRSGPARRPAPGRAVP